MMYIPANDSKSDNANKSSKINQISQQDTNQYKFSHVKKLANNIYVVDGVFDPPQSQSYDTLPPQIREISNMYALQTLNNYKDI